MNKSKQFKTEQQKINFESEIQKLNERIEALELSMFRNQLMEDPKNKMMQDLEKVSEEFDNLTIRR